MRTKTTKRAAVVETDGTYLLRGIDRDLWAEFAERATADGVDMRAALLLCVRGYVDGRIELVAAARPKRVPSRPKRVPTSRREDDAPFAPDERRMR